SGGRGGGSRAANSSGGSLDGGVGGGGSSSGVGGGVVALGDHSRDGSNSRRRHSQPVGHGDDPHDDQHNAGGANSQSWPGRRSSEQQSGRKGLAAPEGASDRNPSPRRSTRAERTYSSGGGRTRSGSYSEDDSETAGSARHRHRGNGGSGGSGGGG
ncbi:unnamed protein product, partial [Phaeothamnion confervicola]